MIQWLTRSEYQTLLSLLDEVEDPTPEETAIAEKIRGIVARMSHRGKRGGRGRRKPLDYPCHALPREQWCDHSGQGDFMGHTCLPLRVR